MRLGRKVTRSDQLLANGVALLSVALVWGISLSLRSMIQPTPNVLFFLAVMLSAWYGGFVPGLVATLLSSLAINYSFIEPYYSLKIADPGSIIRLGVFVVVALLISGLNESRRTALRQEYRLRMDSEAAQSEVQSAKERLESVLSSISDGFLPSTSTGGLPMSTIASAKWLTSREQNYSVIAFGSYFLRLLAQMLIFNFVE